MGRLLSWVILGVAPLAAASCGRGGSRASEQAPSTGAPQTQAIRTPQEVPTHGPETRVEYLGGGSLEQCKVTNQNQALACDYDLGGADLGITVNDPDTATSWVLFGNSMVATSAALGDPNSWETDSDAIGYFPGTSPGDLCDALQLVNVVPASSPQTCGTGEVFSPDPVFAPEFVARGSGSFSIGDFVFQPVLAPAGDLRRNGAIPGTDEVPTGAFYYGGSIYAFYSGAPGVGSSGLPPPSVSYLTTWTPSQTVSVPFSPTRAIISKVDYSLESPPTGWVSPPPIDRHFVQVAPVVSGGYLYMFGTGAFRASWVYLARMPWPEDGSAPVIADYLVNSPGFEVWTGGSREEAGSWSSTVADAIPLFTDDPGNTVVAPNTADVGELSVQIFDAGARLGNVWLMMYTPKGSLQVLMRWATSPGDLGGWSPPIAVFDMSSTANQQAFCCQGGTGSDGNQICDKEQFLECNSTLGPNVGQPLFGPYAPYMLPSITSEGGSVYSISYLLSSFSPYGTQLMSYDIDITRPCGTGRPPTCPLDQVLDPATCACECRCGGLTRDGVTRCLACR
jgi:Domain of unknown function (DUF4185)/CXCXC repeat